MEEATQPSKIKRRPTAIAGLPPLRRWPGRNVNATIIRLTNSSAYYAAITLNPTLKEWFYDYWSG